MSLINDLKEVEIPAKRDMNWYYHGFEYNEKTFNNIIRTGIKSAVARLSLHWGINNGPFYISVTKDVGASAVHSAFYVYNYYCFSFIFDKVLAIPPIYKGDCKEFVGLMPLPIRPKAGWEDEYQAFFKISPKRIIGIQCPVLDNFGDNDYKNKLIKIRKMILQLKEMGCNMPIYDYSRLNGENAHIVNQDGYLKVTKSLEKSVR